ncbi:MAG: hypothetical protein JXE07_04540 [Candidatus Aminicenantes bacterium]|nr:hypothetical protein [Candidatus Aminicenantes bacterium]
MTMASDFHSLRKPFRTAFLVNASLIAGLFLYALIVELIKSQLKPFMGFLPEFHLQPLRYVFYAAAIAAVLVVRGVARSLTRPFSGEDMAGFGGRLSRGAIVTAALAELPAVFGLALFFLTGSSRDFYSLLLVSLILEFIYFPRFKVWQDLVKETFPQEKL